MTQRNEITGAALQSKPTSDEYRNNYDRIFRKKPKPEVHPHWVAGHVFEPVEEEDCEYTGCRKDSI